MKSKKNIKSIFIILVFLMISCFFINISFATNTATINVETANLRETPSSDSKILEQFNVNQEVEILETSGDWYKVKAKGIIGYIRQDLITLKEQTVETNTENNSAQEQQPTEQVQQEEPKEEPVKENVEENVQEQVQENKPEENNSVDENVNIESNQYKIVEDAKLKIIPSINSTDIKELKKDESVILIETINSWVCVQAEETKGWLRVNKLVKEEIKQEEPAQVEEKPQVEEKVEEEVQEQQPEQPQEQPQEQQNEQPQQPETQPVQPVEPQVIKTLFINSQSVNLRKEPNTTSEVITSVVLNTSVTM